MFDWFVEPVVIEYGKLLLIYIAVICVCLVVGYMLGYSKRLDGRG